MSALVSKLEIRISSLEGSAKPVSKAVPNQTPKPVAKPAAKQETKKEEEDDDDVDLFGSDDDVEADEVRKKRLEEYAAKNSKSIQIIIFCGFLTFFVFKICVEPGVVAKSSVVLDVKPWDDETDMKEMEVRVRQIQMDGLLWGACKS